MSIEDELEEITYQARELNSAPPATPESLGCHYALQMACAGAELAGATPEQIDAAIAAAKV